jgi:hypothetical protein
MVCQAERQVTCRNCKASINNQPGSTEIPSSGTYLAAGHAQHLLTGSVGFDELWTV